jgi:hypothetical protein
MRASDVRKMFEASKGASRMYSVELDSSKRVLVISATGHVTEKEVAAAALQIREMMKEVTPGFRVLTNFRWLDHMDPAAATHLGEIMDTLAEKEVTAVVRYSRSAQRHWLKHSFTVPLRTQCPVIYF